MLYLIYRNRQFFQATLEYEIVMIDFLRLYSELFNVLPTGNIQAAMDVAYKNIGIPILALDISYNLIGIAPKTKTGEKRWDYLLDNQKLDPDLIAELYDEGILQSVNDREPPFVIDWGLSEAYPKIEGIIKVKNSVEGYVTMNCTHDQLTEENISAMKIIMDACSIIFSSGSIENTVFFENQKTYIKELFNGTILTNDQLKSWQKALPSELKPPYSVMAIRTERVNEKNVLAYISKFVEQHLTFQFSAIINDVLYVLQYNLNDPDNFDEIDKVLGNIFYRFRAFCGVSNEYQNLLETKIYKMQADNAMMLVNQISPVDRICYYKDCYLSNILIPPTKDLPECSYISPIISTLQQYDQEHNSDFLLTLKTFIKNLCNSTNTCRELNIHRNTILYRIAKIEEITHSNIQNYETFLHLAVSFYMLEHR